MKILLAYLAILPAGTPYIAMSFEKLEARCAAEQATNCEIRKTTFTDHKVLSQSKTMDVKMDRYELWGEK